MYRSNRPSGKAQVDHRRDGGRRTVRVPLGCNGPAQIRNQLPVRVCLPAKRAETSPVFSNLTWS